MSSVVIVRQPSSGFIASSGGNGTTVRDLHQRRSIHKCSADDSATSFAATPAKCRQQHGRGLEEALKVLGEDDSMEVRGLQAALQEARRAAQDRPMAAQVECQAFIERSQKQLGRLGIFYRVGDFSDLPVLDHSDA